VAQDWVKSNQWRKLARNSLPFLHQITTNSSRPEPAAWLFCWHGGTTYAGTNRQPYRSSGTDKESVQKRHNGFQLLAAPSSQETGVLVRSAGVFA
jgi:hypothetical protein